MIQPLSGRVLVELIEETRTSSGLLFLPEKRKENRTLKGKVVSVGKDHLAQSGKIWKAPVKEGDFCFVNRVRSAKIDRDGKKFAFAAFEDVLAYDTYS